MIHHLHHTVARGLRQHHGFIITMTEETPTLGDAQLALTIGDSLLPFRSRGEAVEFLVACGYEEPTIARLLPTGADWQCWY